MVPISLVGEGRVREREKERLGKITPSSEGRNGKEGWLELSIYFLGTKIFIITMG